MDDMDDNTLLDAAQAVSDGMPVDWGALKAKYPDLAEDLARMEAMAEVVRAYRTLRQEEDAQSP